jgi:poly-gamma-glutamate capsule biosynthesis protein CapA/YwtB (metallophosphatase superfamily)
MQIYIGFVTAGILIVAGMLFMSTKHELPIAVPAQHASILFGGDMLFDRSIRSAVNEKGGDFVFTCLDPLLKAEDLVVANLEGPITEHASISEDSIPGDGNNYTFTFPTSTATLLYAHNIRMVNIGNNHIMNFKLEGLNETKKYLAESGVGFFGDPDSTEPNKVARIDIQGIPFSFVNWSDWTSDNTDITAAQVKKEHDAGRIVVVYTHWGEEYKPATAREKRLAHDFIDEGADIVIGSHPHVVQEHEIYKGKNIYYSLGNLIFDQYFDDSVDHGLMIQVIFDKKGVQDISEIPVHLQQNRQSCPEIDIHRMPLVYARAK